MLEVFRVQAAYKERFARGRTAPTPKQLSLIAMRFSEIGMMDRRQRLYHLVVLTGRYLTSSKELTYGEGSALLDLLNVPYFISYLKGETHERFQQVDPQSRRTA